MAADTLLKFKQVLHYIISNTESHKNVGKKVLYKLLYFNDFDYYELNEEKMTGEIYAKLRHGPAPRHFGNIADELKKEGFIDEVVVDYHGYQQIRYRSLQKPDVSLLTENEIKHIDETLQRYGSMNGFQIESLSHKDMPWIASKDNEDINYDLVFYRSAEMSVREYGDDDDD